MPDEPDLSWPAYVTIHMNDDETVAVSTNCETTADVRRLLAAASFHMADDMDWEAL